MTFLLSASSPVLGRVLAQNILLKSGQTIETKGVRRSGDMVMGKVQVGASSGEVGYQASTIAKIDFPEPPQLKTTEAFLAQGESEEGPRRYWPGREILRTLSATCPGNWWAQAALLKVSALGGMQLDREAEALGEEIRKSATDPETARAAQLQLVPGLVRTENFEKAIQLCDAVIKDSTKPEVLAEAWVRRAMRFSPNGSGTAPSSLICMCRSFIEDEKRWMPQALLGSARAFRGLEDLERAKKSLNDLTAEYPKSAQAEMARAELQKLPK